MRLSVKKSLFCSKSTWEAMPLRIHLSDKKQSKKLLLSKKKGTKTDLNDF